MGQIVGMKMRSGFTLIEILIMLSVIIVVGVITFPKFQTMLHQSRESHTKNHLGDLRGALAIYYSDNFGLYPSDEGTPETRLVNLLVPQYIKEIPHVELVHYHSKKLNSVQDRFDDTGDWMYSMLNGYIAVNCSHADTKGNSISSW